MSQEYTEDKDISLQAMSSGRRLLEALLLIIALFSIWLMVALVSFDPADPSWSQTAWHEPIRNLGGRAGAWLADTLFFIFGVMAWAIPPVIFGLCWIVFRQRSTQPAVNYFVTGLRLIGILALVVTSCGLAALSADDIWYFASGGVIGSLVSSAMAPWFSGPGGTLVLLCIWAAGLTLYTGWSWLTIAEKIGAFVFGILTFTRNRIDPESPSQDEQRLTPVTSDANEENEQDDVLLAGISGEEPTKGEALSSSLEEASLVPEVAVKTQAVREQETAVPPTETVVPAAESHQAVEAELPVDEIATQGAQSAAEAHFALLDDALLTADKEPSLGDWQTATIPSATAKPTDTSTRNNAEEITPSASEPTSVASLSEMATGPATTPSQASNATVHAHNPQVKQGIGPELPRPKPVRIPTRRELASYGIKLPSQRLAEQKVKQQQYTASEPVSPLPQSDVQQPYADEEAHLRAAFKAQQQQRYGTTTEEEEDALQQAALARQFEQLQQQRYGEQLNNAPQIMPNPPQESAFSSAAMLTTDTSPAEEAGEPLFTIAPSHEAEAQVRVSPQPASILPQPTVSATATQSEMAAAAQPVTTAAASTPAQTPAFSKNAADSLIHPFLMRNEQPLQKPTTPLPQLDLLTAPPETTTPPDSIALEQTARLVETRLADYRVKAKVVGVSPGPVITRFELDLAPGVKAARISNLSRDLARSLSAVAVRVVEVIPGKPYVGLELPNKHRQTVYLRDVLDCARFRESQSPLSVVLGKDIAGQPVVADLAKMPHLLVAGTTGSGKSVGVNAMIISMLYKATPEQVRFIMIDPKMLELSVYEGIPHLLTEVVTDMKDAANALRWSVGEMERRYKLMSALGVRNLAGYNEKIEQADAMGRPIPDPFWKPGDSMDATPAVLEKLPYIVVMVDEFADLMMAVGKKVEELIARLAQKARAAGIHLVLATQRPSVDVITGLIKANIPTRIAFTVSSKIDSRTILDQGGAESLLGMGDMLYMPPNSSIPVRVHGAFVRDQEVHAVVQDWKARGRPQHISSITAGNEGENGAGGLDGEEELDPLFDQAVTFVTEKRRASISGVQRQFRIGYNRAARIVEQMEAQGIVSPPGHNGNREVLAPPAHEL